MPIQVREDYNEPDTAYTMVPFFEFALTAVDEGRAASQQVAHDVGELDTEDADDHGDLPKLSQTLIRDISPKLKVIHSQFTLVPHTVASLHLNLLALSTSTIFLKSSMPSILLASLSSHPSKSRGCNSPH